MLFPIAEVFVHFHHLMTANISTVTSNWSLYFWVCSFIYFFIRIRLIFLNIFFQIISTFSKISKASLLSMVCASFYSLRFLFWIIQGLFPIITQIISFTLPGFNSILMLQLLLALFAAHYLNTSPPICLSNLIHSFSNTQGISSQSHDHCEKHWHAFSALVWEWKICIFCFHA